MKKLKIVKIDSNYCEYLRKYDNKVYYNAGSKQNRPFVGVLFEINKLQYFAPLTSPKLKHLKMKNTMDFFKIDNGKLGAINFNNMIPVINGVFTTINLKIKPTDEKEKKYIKLLQEQLYWLNAHSIQIEKKSMKLYNAYLDNKLNERMKLRCCNYILLEQKCKEYKKYFTNK